MFENLPGATPVQPPPRRNIPPEPEDILEGVEGGIKPNIRPPLARRAPASNVLQYSPSAPAAPTAPRATPPALPGQAGQGARSGFPPLRSEMKKEPEDILSPVEPTAQKPIFRTPQATSRPGMPVGLELKSPTISGVIGEEPLAEHRKPLLKSKVFIIIFLAIVVTGGLAFAGYFAYQQFASRGATSETDGENIVAPQGEEAVPTPEETVPAPTPAEVSPIPTPASEPADSDLDGITDQEEQQYRTDPNNADSDSDGLSDRDEVKTWQTDPLNPDTDGDGFKDGEEISNRYNPKGQGKLFEGQ